VGTENTRTAHWIDRCRALLESNRVESRGYRYTRPAPSRYEQQWLWDSCFHAIILRHFDPAMARDELLSVVAHQLTDGDDAGMIPHMSYWDGGGAGLWGRDDRSIITQPPLIAIAAERVYSATGDRDLLAALYAPLLAYHAWFDRRRDPDHDGLVTLIHPWESGWDASPRWDRPMRLSDDPSDDESRLARTTLMETLIAHGCDARTLAQAGHFHVEPADFNAIRARDLEALAAIADVLSESDEASRLRAQAERVRAAIIAKCWRDGRMLDLSGPDETPIMTPTAGEFVTLFAGLPDRMAETLIARLREPANWPRYPVPTSPADAPNFAGDRYWRGNVWLNVNWLIWDGLRRAGHAELARELAERSLALVEANDFHEYFNPHTGQGFGSYPHSWTAIVLDMLVAMG
jgi:glycogen debranching enzyme